MRRAATVLLLGGLLVSCSEQRPTGTESEDVLLERAGDPSLSVTNSPWRGFHIILTPAEEVPPSSSISYGDFKMLIHQSGRLTWQLKLYNPGCETFIAGHIHLAPPGAPGPVVVPLFAGSLTQKKETLRGFVQLSDSTRKAILENPRGYYVNFHSTLNPPGAQRGQLGPGDPTPNPPALPPGACS
jgi:hypothetical protein